MSCILACKLNRVQETAGHNKAPRVQTLPIPNSQRSSLQPLNGYNASRHKTTKHNDRPLEKAGTLFFTF